MANPLQARVVLRLTRDLALVIIECISKRQSWAVFGYPTAGSCCRWHNLPLRFLFAFLQCATRRQYSYYLQCLDSCRNLLERANRNVGREFPQAAFCRQEISQFLADALEQGVGH